MPKFVMSDGRAFTDYTPSCSLNQAIQKKYNVPADTHKYRYFLQQNGEQVKKDLAANYPYNTCVFCPVCKEAIQK